MKSEASGAGDRLRSVLPEVAIIVAVFAVTVLQRTSTGHGIPCLFFRATELKCFGLGMTTALISLLLGGFGAAFSVNPLSVTILPIPGVYFIYKLITYVKKGTEPFKVREWAHLITPAAVCLSFGI